jgi:hypothetical protein
VAVIDVFARSFRVRFARIIRLNISLPATTATAMTLPILPAARRVELSLALACIARGVTLKRFEQPCARDHDGALEDVLAGLPNVPGARSGRGCASWSEAWSKRASA